MRLSGASFTAVLTHRAQRLFLPPKSQSTHAQLLISVSVPLPKFF